MLQLKQYQYRSALIKQRKHVPGYKPLRRLNVCFNVHTAILANRLEFK